MFSFRNSPSVSQSEKVGEDEKVRRDRPAYAHAGINTDDVITAEWRKSCCACAWEAGGVACAVQACAPATVIGDPLNCESLFWL